MKALTIRTTEQLTPAGTLQAGLFNDFIAYIDRGEKTTRTYIVNFRQFIAYLRYNGITQPTRADIIAYRDYLTTEHDAIKLDASTAAGWTYRTDANGNRCRISCKPNTTAQYLRSVCQFFRWTAANNLYPDIAANIHAPKIRHDDHKKDALDAAATLTIENSILLTAEARTEAAGHATKDTAGRTSRATEQGKRLYAMYLLAVNAGLRTIELSRANVKDLELNNGNAYLFVWGKGHTQADQRKPIAPEVYAAIKDYLDSRADKVTGSSPLFVSTGNRSGGKRIATTTISTMLKKAMQEAGFNSERLTAHSLRHSTGTAIMTITGNLFAAQKYMRHADPKTTEIYIHEIEAAEQESAALAQNVYNLFHGKIGG